MPSKTLTDLSPPTAIDLFCGAGGLSFGLRQAGFDVLVGADTDSTALATFTANVGAEAIVTPVGSPTFASQLDTILKGRSVDLVAGGPPCQPFSRAGEAKLRSLGRPSSSDARAGLWHAFVDIVERVQPRLVLMENVPDFAASNPMRLVALVRRLIDLDYQCDARVIRTWELGVPQHRRRLFVVAARSAQPGWPATVAPITVGEAIGDLPRLDRSVGAAVLSYDAPQTPYQVAARSSVPAADKALIFDHVTRAVRDDDAEAFALLGPGSKYSDLPDRLRRYRDDIFQDKYNRLAWDGLSRTITAHIAKDGYWYIHPREARTITVREAARLQTFPDHFRFAGPRSSAFRQIGNAVPPIVAEAIGSGLISGSHARTETSWRARGEALAHLHASPSDLPLDLRDSAVRRVARRVVGPSAIRTETDALIGVAMLVASGDPRAMHGAIQEVASRWCKPRSPICDACPLRFSCDAGRQRAQSPPDPGPTVRHPQGVRAPRSAGTPIHAGPIQS